MLKHCYLLASVWAWTGLSNLSLDWKGWSWYLWWFSHLKGVCCYGSEVCLPAGILHSHGKERQQVWWCISLTCTVNWAAENPSVPCKLLLQEWNRVSMSASLQLPSKLKSGDPHTNQCFTVARRPWDSTFSPWSSCSYVSTQRLLESSSELSAFTFLG